MIVLSNQVQYTLKLLAQNERLLEIRILSSFRINYLRPNLLRRSLAILLIPSIFADTNPTSEKQTAN